MMNSYEPNYKQRYEESAEREEQARADLRLARRHYREALKELYDVRMYRRSCLYDWNQQVLSYNKVLKGKIDRLAEEAMSEKPKDPGHEMGS